ncbi:BamA/TamA family outer membrane protein [Salmonirosea aquatica]|uniref:BamA/TamA family outer membrane protein n=1 Tax=Salmonirosea aquatica TaxID=2654236 RepID=A0A7C9FEH1_9BACT|nr:BamA/TamA family outer membrane protein [Cytophagaceae bacterium SJW1-29]
MQSLRLVCFVLLSHTLLAVPFLRDTTEKASAGKLFRDTKFIVLPVVFKLPETGWGGGVVGTTTFSFARDSSFAKPSQVSFGATYTQKKQILFFVPFTVFYDNNRFYFNGDNGWFKYNFNYYGIGEERVPQEIFDVTFPRIRLVGARLIAPKTYAGLRYQYESYRVTGTQEGGELATGRIAGSDFSRTSSLGPSFLRDSRDQVFYPRRGMFGELYILPTAKIFGADRNFTRIYLDVANYFSLTKKLVLATNYTASAIFSKEVPFSQLSFLGGPKKMRGIYEGFFRDKNALLGQAELRWEVWRFLGLTGFGSLGFLGNEGDIMRFNRPKYTYGAGLRITAQKKNHLNIRVDYGFSPYADGNLYLTIGEAF